MGGSSLAKSENGEATCNQEAAAINPLRSRA